jgi:hypothetical protein
MTAHHLTVQPVRIREPHPLLGVDASRVVAYRARCSCGWRGPRRDTVREARPDAYDHARAERAASRPPA